MSSPCAPTKARVLPRRVHAKPRTLLDLTSPRVVREPAVEDVVAASQDVFFGVEQEVPQGVRSIRDGSESNTHVRTLNRLVEPDINFLWSIANRVTAEVGRAITSKCVRIVNVTEKTTAPTIQTSVSILNCTKSWNLDVEPPFVKKNLGILGAMGTTHKDPPYQELCSFDRHLLTRITDPPEKIKDYSVRLTAGMEGTTS